MNQRRLITTIDITNEDNYEEMTSHLGTLGVWHIRTYYNSNVLLLTGEDWTDWNAVSEYLNSCVNFDE